MINWLKNWFNRRMITLMLAFSKTENAIRNATGGMDMGVGSYQRTEDGLLAQALINGVMTQEVKELRWRIYKILEHTQGVKTEITGYDEDGMPITLTKKVNMDVIRSYKVDNVDDDIYNRKLLMVIGNKVMSGTLVEGMDSVDLDKGSDIGFDEYLTTFKSKRSIFISRDTPSPFEIEKYTKKMCVSSISTGDDLVMLDFYVSKYPDMDDRRSRFFISEIKKIIGGKRLSGVTDITKVMYITQGDLGVPDYLEYEYEVVNFDKIISFDGNYVIKFIAKKRVFGDNILEKFKLEDLDHKYNIKQSKK